MNRIVVKNLSKKLSIGFKKNENTLSRIISLLSIKETKKEVWVLKNISFKLKNGEVIGLLGENGSGKSTLLRTIAGIYKKNKGIIEINGRIIPLINLNAGFKKKLTMKENIYLCCSIYGLSDNSIKKIFKSIVSFAELEKYTNTKIYQFSTGMITRLSFSIAIKCTDFLKPEILLLDEVFIGGDESFRRKGKKELKKILRNECSVLVASHLRNLLLELCDKIIWIESGKIKKIGEPKSIVKQYLETI